MIVIDKVTMTVIPNELIYRVIELLGSDPMWWLTTTKSSGNKKRKLEAYE